MNLQESGEMYLETILRLTDKNERVRSIDVSEEMGFSKPSVSRALGILKSGDFISVDEDGYITLNECGKALAEQMYDRHTVLTRALVSLGVDEKTAAVDACRIEHVISDESFAAVKKHFSEG